MVIIPICVIGWSLIYFFLQKWNSGCSTEWNSRIVAFLHAFIASRSIEIFMLKFAFEFEEFGRENSPFHGIMLLFSLSYFFFETFWCLYMQTEGVVMIIHHIVSLGSLLSCYVLNMCGYEVCLLIWCAEFTNPFLQLRWFLRSMELHKSLFAKVNEFFLFLIFWLMRGVFGLCFTYKVSVTPGLPLVLQLGAYAFQIVNFMFLYQIVLLAKRRWSSKEMDRSSLTEENKTH